MTLPACIAVMLLLCACLIAVLVKTTPYGFETDEHGFQYGEPGDPRDGEG